MVPEPNRFEVVQALVASESQRPDDKPGIVGSLQRLCRAATRSLPAMGVGISVMSQDGDPATVAASETHIELVEDLQFTLGEGPCIDAFTTGRPALAPDLQLESNVRWPGYAPVAREHGVAAAFAFPLQIGAARLGALDVYQDQVGYPEREVLVQALTYADVAMTALLNAQEHSNHDIHAPGLDEALDSRFELYQAQGMVKVHLGVSLHEAMARIRAHAYANNRPLSEVAIDIVARRLVLEADS